MKELSNARHLLAVFVVGAVVLGLFSGVAAAQSSIGGTTVVESEETVSSIDGVYGTIIVEGTVTGDISGVAGNIVIREGGVVEGDLDAAAGNIRIEGTIGGDISAGAGSVHITEAGVIETDVRIGAGDVRIDGVIDGDAQIGAEAIRLGDDASIAGSLTYDGDLVGNRDAVEGDITRDRSIGPSVLPDLQPLASWIFTLYAFVLNLILGALLLAVFPRFSAGVADRVAADPIKSGLVGLGILIGIPVLLIAIAITVIGIPITLIGLFLFLVLCWIALVYGRFAVGAWLLSLADIQNRWAALVVGLVFAAALSFVPFLGSFLNFFIFLLGLGALTLGLVTRRRGGRNATGETAATGPAE